MEKKSGKMSYVLTEALVWMGALQAALWGMKWLLLPLFPDTRAAYKLFTMGCMLLLTGVVVANVKYGCRERFSFLPHTWNRRYTLFTGLFLLLLILSPSNFKQGLPAVGVLLHGLMNLLSICHVWWESSLGDTIH